MVNLLIIKNIWDKIYIHPFFYFIVTISFFTGHFRNIIYFTILILIHELGHSITGIMLGIRLKKIKLFPFGSLSVLEYNINLTLVKELLILVMGPVIQIIFTYLIYYLKIDVSYYFYTYSMFILLFNLIPIYPLDGGKLINIFFSFFLSFYKSLKITYYLSYFIYISLVFIIIFYYRNLVLILIIFSLGIELIKVYINRYNIYIFNYKNVL